MWERRIHFLAAEVRETSSWPSGSRSRLASAHYRAFFPGLLSRDLREEFFDNSATPGIPHFRQTELHFPRLMIEKSPTTERRSGHRAPIRVPVKVRHEGNEHA